MCLSIKKGLENLNYTFTSSIYQCLNTISLGLPQINQFCKLVFFYFTLTNISQCTSTSLSSNTTKIVRLRQLLTGIDKSNHVATEYNLKKPKLIKIRPSEGAIVAKLLSRKSRSSKRSCRALVKPLLRLAIHTYTKSHDAHDERIRRSTLHRFQQEEGMNQRWQHVHNHMKLLLCKVRQYPQLFIQITQSIENAILSMLGVLEEGMRKLNLRYDKASFEACPPIRGNTSERTEAAAFLNGLFSLCQELERICDRTN